MGLETEPVLTLDTLMHLTPQLLHPPKFVLLSGSCYLMSPDTALGPRKAPSPLTPTSPVSGGERDPHARVVPVSIRQLTQRWRMCRTHGAASQGPWGGGRALQLAAGHGDDAGARADTGWRMRGDDAGARVLMTAGACAVTTLVHVLTTAGACAMTTLAHVLTAGARAVTTLARTWRPLLQTPPLPQRAQRLRRHRFRGFAARGPSPNLTCIRVGAWDAQGDSFGPRGSSSMCQGHSARDLSCDFGSSPSVHLGRSL